MTPRPQPLDGEHKDKVKAWVPKLRQLLENDLTQQLTHLGIPPGGHVTPLDAMNLSEEARRTRRRAEALLEHETAAENSRERGYRSVLRHLTYTFLNRLVGLKAMETRGLLFLPPPADPAAEPEQTEVITPVPGQALSRYLRDLRAAGGSRYKYAEGADAALLRDGLTIAFRHVTREIRVLFDPDHEHGCVWPSHPRLVEAIERVNTGLPEAAYQAPDFLGWVYQFFNRDEKKRVRDENKGTPRSSYELAVINQFYTPTWVVKALVDNTLGRLWLQMHPDSALAPGDGEPSDERLVTADYLVPRTGERIRFKRVGSAGQVERWKVVRDITLLDPACGTMHFGQYAFALFERMYEEELEHAGQEGWPAKPSVTRREEIPRAIVENNLFGVDIDLRAIQIGALSLLLTAKESGRRLGVDPRRVRLGHTNLVVANGVDLGQDKLQGLVDRLHIDHSPVELRRRLFQAVWDNLRQVGELGSLVQVQESADRVLEGWVQQQARERGWTRMIPSAVPEQLELAGLKEELQSAQAEQLQLQLRLLEGQAATLRDELLAAVDAAAAEVGDDPTQRLFAEDTAQGLRLLQLLGRRYDVVVMNPPYGAFVPAVKELVRSMYPSTANDIYAAFLDRATRLVEPHGYVGALVSSTFKTNSSFEKLRTEILLKRNPIKVMLDLGFGILDDATVEAAAVVLAGSAG